MVIFNVQSATLDFCDNVSSKLSAIKRDAEDYISSPFYITLCADVHLPQIKL
jgi:hypothetical protein